MKSSKAYVSIPAVKARVTFTRLKSQRKTGVTLMLKYYGQIEIALERGKFFDKGIETYTLRNNIR